MFLFSVLIMRETARYSAPCHVVSPRRVSVRPLTRGPLVVEPSVVLTQPSATRPRGAPSTARPAPSDVRAADERCQQIVLVDGLDSEAVIGIAFASFIIGVFLTASIWFSYTSAQVRNNCDIRSHRYVTTVMYVHTST